MNIKITIYSLLTLSVLSFFCCKKFGDSQAAADLKSYETGEEPDPSEAFTRYKDSLKVYFSELEIKLIRQYHINHENIRTLDDFYHFYANSLELQRQLTASLKDYIKKNKLKPNQYPLLPWFTQVAKGLIVGNSEYGYGVYLDCDDFKVHAEGTKETADDRFVQLIEMVYEPASNLPKWLKVGKKGNFCSDLGSGLHYKVLRLIDDIMTDGAIFENELIKIQKMAMYDLLNANIYCRTFKEVSAEIENILRDVDTKKQTENQIRSRLASMKSSPEFHFGCINTECE